MDAHRRPLEQTAAMQAMAQWFKATQRTLTIGTDQLLEQLTQLGDLRTPQRFGLSQMCPQDFLPLAVPATMAWLDRPVLPLPSAGQLNAAILWKAIWERRNLLLPTHKLPRLGCY